MRKHLLLTCAMLLPLVAAAAPEVYTIDNTHTYPRFEYNHLGYSIQSHRFTKTSGRIVLDRAARSGSVEVTIDAKSVDTGYALFNEHIQAEDFFDTAKHPTITYRADRLRFEGERLVEVDGQLTIKGITRPVKLTVTSFHCMPHPILKKDACGANAVARVKRSDFNMGKYAPAVSDEVTIHIPVEAIKQ
ncbi:MAG: YceI family protein [Sutterellaceae bacterium]|nr:YceI family protein [Burkholderiaceae bacterium]MDW8430219.1 YceI family protein [Sutterellaceae bacterium]